VGYQYSQLLPTQKRICVRRVLHAVCRSHVHVRYVGKTGLLGSFKDKKTTRVTASRT